MNVDELLVKLFEQSPTWGVVAGVLYLFWRSGERKDAAFQAALKDLGQKCHEAHQRNADEFRETAEQLTGRYEDQAAKAAEVASRVHTALGAVGEQFRSFADLSRDLASALRASRG